MERRLDRREFTLEAVVALLGGVAITVSGCGGGSSMTNPDPVPSAGPGDEVGRVGTNHGHTAVVSAAQLAAGAGFSLQIRGQSDHPHTVSLSTADVTGIAAGQPGFSAAKWWMFAMCPGSSTRPSRRT